MSIRRSRRTATAGSGGRPRPRPRDLVRLARLIALASLVPNAPFRVEAGADLGALKYIDRTFNGPTRLQATMISAMLRLLLPTETIAAPVHCAGAVSVSGSRLCVGLGCHLWAYQGWRAKGCRWQRPQPSQALVDVDEKPFSILYCAKIASAQREIRAAPGHSGQLAPCRDRCEAREGRRGGRRVFVFHGPAFIMIVHRIDACGGRTSIDAG